MKEVIASLKKMSGTTWYRIVMFVIQAGGASFLAMLVLVAKQKIREEVIVHVAPIETNLSQQIVRWGQEMKESNRDLSEQIKSQGKRFDEYVRTSQYLQDLGTAEKVNRLEKQLNDNRILAVETTVAENRKDFKSALEKMTELNVKVEKILTEMQRK